MISFKAFIAEQQAFHGTPHDFTDFLVDPTNYMLDRALGIHFSKDPAIANSFIENRTNGRLDSYKEGGRIIRANIPDDKHFFVVPQPMYPHAIDKDWPLSQKVRSDQTAIEAEIALRGFAHSDDVDLLPRHLRTSRGMGDTEAQQVANTLNASPDKARAFFINYGGRPYAKSDRVKLVQSAVKSWQADGYVGLKYINTSPMETTHATDPTSYVVFDHKDILPYTA